MKVCSVCGHGLSQDLEPWLFRCHACGFQRSRLAEQIAGSAAHEAIDERARELPLFDQEISLGDFILPGGEVAALALVEALSRLVPGVVARTESVERESFMRQRLDYPHYTRPREFRGLTVPDVLLSGNHARIERWRRARALEATRKKRPDLLVERPEEPGESDE